MVAPIKFGVNGPENRLVKFSAAPPISYPYTVIDLANSYTDAHVLGMSIADINIVFPAYTDPAPRAASPAYPGPVFSTLSHSLAPRAITQAMLSGGLTSFVVNFSFSGVALSGYIDTAGWSPGNVPSTTILEITSPAGFPAQHPAYVPYQQSVYVYSCEVFLPGALWGAAEWRTADIVNRLADLAVNPLPTLAAAQWETAVLNLLLVSPYHLQHEAWAIDAEAVAADYAVALSAARATLAGSFRNVDVVSLVLNGDVMSASAPRHVQVFLPENQPSWAANTFLQVANRPRTDAKRVRFFLGPPTSTDKTALYIEPSSGMWFPGYGPNGQPNTVLTVYDKIVSPPPEGTAYVDYSLGSDGVWRAGPPSRPLVQADLDVTQVHVYLLPPRVTDAVAAAENRVLAFVASVQSLADVLPDNEYALYGHYISYATVPLPGVTQFCEDIALVESAYISLSSLNMYARNWQKLPLFPSTGGTPTSMLYLLYNNLALLVDEALGAVDIQLDNNTYGEGVNGLYSAFPPSVDPGLGVAGELSRLPMVSYNGGYDWLVRIPPRTRYVSVGGIGVTSATVGVAAVDDHFMMVPRWFGANLGGSNTLTVNVLLWKESDESTHLSLLYTFVDGGGTTQNDRLDIASTLGVQYGHRIVVTHSRLLNTGALVDGLYVYAKEVGPPISGVSPLLSGVCYIPSYDVNENSYYANWLPISNGVSASYAFNDFGEPSLAQGYSTSSPRPMYPHFATGPVLIDDVLSAHPVNYYTTKRLSRLRVMRNGDGGGPFMLDILRTSMLERGVAEQYNVGEHHLTAISDGTTTDISDTYTPISGSGIAAEVVTYIQASDASVHP